MTGDQFSLKARRTTRIPLRIPVLVVLEENASSLSLDAWTMIVNIHGAKIECKRKIELHKEVLIRVPFNGMSQKGKVVWTRAEANEHGNFEIGVELDRPENLWGVGFPPSDWDATRNAKMPVTDAKPPAGPEPTSSGTSPTVHGAAKRASEHSKVPEDIPAPILEPTMPNVIDHSLVELNEAIPEWTPGENDPPAEEGGYGDIVVDAPEPAVAPATPTAADRGLANLNDVPPDWTPGESVPPAYESVTEFSALQMSPLEEEMPMLSPQAGQEVKTPEAGAASSPESSLGFGNLEHLLAGNPTVAPVPAEQPLGKSPKSAPAGDRLSAIFDELVESALQTRVLGLVERVGQRIEGRIAEIETSALARAERRIEASASSQCQALENRALDFVASQQQLLEQNVQRFLEDAEARAHQRQQEFLEESRQAMRLEAADLAASCRNRLKEETELLLEFTRSSLRQTLEEQLPPMEKEMLERCRTQAERLLASQVEQWTLLFSDRVRDAQQTMNQQVDAAAEQAASRQAAALEVRSEELIGQMRSRLEQQMSQIGTQVRQSFLRHIVTELSKNQEVWIERAQRQLEDLAEQNLQWTRRNVSLVMRNFGEALLRQAYLEGASPSVAPASTETPETQAALNLTEDKVAQDCP